MRIGSDRFSVGEHVFGMWFPEGSPRLRSWRIGDELSAIVAGEGEPAAHQESKAEWTWTMEDPNGSGRLLSLWTELIKDRVVRLHARFVSRDRMDIDSAWRLVKDHLDKVHGQPDRQLGSLLKLIWTVKEEENPTVITGCRFRQDDGQQTLDVVQTLRDGARLHVGGRTGPTSPPAGGRPPPRAP